MDPTRKVNDMFVQSKDTTRVVHKNGVALRQRRGDRETLVQWQNGDQRWDNTDSLQGEIRLLDREGLSYEQA